jgi:GPH family glycoside/pentoside/hexuronide:cation symporter
MDEKSARSAGKSSIGEKVSYGLGGVGYQMTLALTNAYLVLYYTDSVLISASLVGSMMFVARLFDGASDIAMGFVIEKTSTRLGKARPWVVIGAVPLAVSVCLLFNVPSALSPMSKNAYVFCTYMFMSVICYTIVAIAHNSMLPRLSLIPSDRNVASVVLGLMQGIMTALIVGVFSPLLTALGGESSQHAWTVISALFAAMSFILLAACFLLAKEKIPAVAEPDEGAKKAKEPIRESLAFLLKSKYFYIIIVLYLTSAMTNGTAGIGVYYMRDVLGNANLMGVYSIMAVIPMIIMMPLVPKLFSAFGKRKALLMCLGAVLAIKGATIFFPTNVPIQLAATFFGTLAIVPLWLASPTMVCDLVDYGDYKRGIRAEGLATSASSFGTKLGTGLGSVMLGIGLTLGGYNAALSVQPDSAANAIIIIMLWLPLIICVVCFLLIWIWDLEKHKDEVGEYMSKKISKQAE